MNAWSYAARMMAVGVMSIVVPLSASAGRIEAADGAFDNVAGSNYSFDGQFWQGPESPSSIINPAPGTIFNMALDFGSGPVTGLKFRFFQTGRVEFLTSNGVPNGDYIEPFGLSGGYSNIYANSKFTNGLLAPIYLTATTFPNGTFDPVNGLQAFRFQWQGICPNSQININNGLCNPNGFLNFQALLIATDSENFQLQFNYQNDAGSIPSDLVKAGSFKFGTNTGTYSGPFVDTGPNFCFHNGVLLASCTGTSAIPEPGTVPLAALGAVMFGIAWRRGRRRRANV